MKKHKQQETGGRKPTPVWMRVIIILLVFILALVAAAGITINTVLNKINRPDINAEYYSEEELRELDLAEAVRTHQPDEPDDIVYPELNREDIIWTAPADQIASSNTILNFLLIGQDAREGETRARSDSMILVTFNKQQKTITMCSFLRDLYVQIPGYNDNRLNAAYAFGGMQLLDDTIEKNFGIHIDANLEVRFEAFQRIIDILGGVDINLTSAEAEYMKRSPGLQHVDGETALAYSRIRYIDSDFGRTGRQRNVLTSVYDTYKHASMKKTLELVNEIFPLLTTDLSNTEILAYAADLFPMLAGSTMTSMYVPAEGTYSFNTIDSMAVIVADMEANRDILKETLE